MSPRPVARAREHAGRASSSALLHGLGGLAIGAAMLSEDRAGYAYPVFDGPRQILAFLPDPITGWGAIFLVLGALVLAFRERGSRVALTALAGAWAVFAGGALALGLSSTAAATAGGLAWAIVAADAARAALEYRRIAATLPLTAEVADALATAPLPPPGEESAHPRET